MVKIQTKAVLEQLRSEDLKLIARKLNLSRNITRKADLINEFQRLFENDLPKILDLCTDKQKTLLAEAAYGQGKVQKKTFKGKYGYPCPQRNYSWPSKDISPFNLLVFNSEDGRHICVLPDIVESLRQLLPKPEKVTIKTADTIEKTYKYDAAERPIHIFEGESVVFTELRQMLSMVQAGKIKVAAKSKRPTDSSVRQISTALVLPDFELDIPEKIARRWDESAGAVRAHAWGVILQQCGWCKVNGNKLDFTRTGKKLLSGITPSDLKTGFLRYLRNDSFDEMNRINNIRGQTGKGKREMTRVSDRKVVFCNSMEHWPVNKWIGFNDACRFAMASGKMFDLCHSDPWNLYFCDKNYGSLGYNGIGEGLERQFLRVFLFESLATLGLVDVAYTWPHHLWPEMGNCWGVDDLSFCGRYDGLLYVKLNSLGAYCLGICDKYEAPKIQQRKLFKVLSNHELASVQDCEIPAADLCTLELFAKPKSEFVWKLDKNRILKHIESGGSIENLKLFLKNKTDGEIPETVHIFLRDIEKKLSAFCGIQDAILIEVNDKTTAALIAHDSHAGKCCYPAGSFRLVVPKKKERAFRSALKKMGYVLPQ
ncbi:hypothetical protein SMSP2_02260 [Limihaloglobus sulfuriphilus]|uniref:Uncharacterized protein n=1 Tax=Limihaloglobus sulfuriphilus TaxID=1851148 RepID=A0A1Q2MGR6_9BACT|nr:hypothetical protein [Limihaloglobus sulfuriphilus]AQQ71881.1 hypothetical protein SMSP2_02260 [Limihaloglobus sulfuriphilus]